MINRLILQDFRFGVPRPQGPGTVHERKVRVRQQLFPAQGKRGQDENGNRENGTHSLHELPDP